ATDYRGIFSASPVRADIYTEQNGCAWGRSLSSCGQRGLDIHLRQSQHGKGCREDTGSIYRPPQRDGRASGSGLGSEYEAHKKVAGRRLGLGTERYCFNTLLYRVMSGPAPSFLKIANPVGV